MTTIVIGGHTRNIGKTSVAAGLITSLPEYQWIAMKITQYGHGVCSINGKACGCAVEEHPFAILEERERDRFKDTSRFLAAGARRSLWVRTKQGQLESALPQLKRVLEREPFIIIESNSILQFIRPDLYLVVLSFGSRDFKKSAQQFLPNADAAVMVDSDVGVPAWTGIGLDVLARIPKFSVKAPNFASAELTEFVRSKIGNP